MTNDEYLRSLTPEELAEWFKAKHEDALSLIMERDRYKRLYFDAVSIADDYQAQLADAIRGWHESNRGWAEALMKHDRQG